MLAWPSWLSNPVLQGIATSRDRTLCKRNIDDDGHVRPTIGLSRSPSHRPRWCAWNGRRFSVVRRRSAPAPRGSRGWTRRIEPRCSRWASGGSPAVHRGLLYFGPYNVSSLSFGPLIVPSPWVVPWILSVCCPRGGDLASPFIRRHLRPGP